jgi:peptidyl-prolyl cis-trans isomerase C
MQRIVVGCLLAVVLVTGGCGKPQGGALPEAASGVKSAPSAGKSGRVIATFADETFTEGEFRDEMGRLSRRARGALSDAERRRQFVDNYVLSRLIYKKGVEKKFDTDPEVLKQLEDLQRRLVIQRVMQEQQTAPVDDTEVKAYYDAHSAEFATDRVRASHILVIDEAVAKDLLAKLRKDPSQFENLAKDNSIDKANAEKGGDLGFFGRGRMVKEFEEAAFALSKDGEISEVVHTRFGYHIIKRTGREEGKTKPFEEVKNQIRIRLINDRRRQKTEDFLESLKQESGYQVDMEVLAAVPVDDLPEPEGAEDLPAGH